MDDLNWHEIGMLRLLYDAPVLESDVMACAIGEKRYRRTLNSLVAKGYAHFSTVSDNRRWMIVMDGVRAVEAMK